MRLGATPTEVSGGVGPADGASQTSHPRRRRRLAWASLAVAAALAVSAVTWVGVRASSKPAVSGADVGKIVDKKVGKAVTDLKSEPPAGVGVFATVRPQLVVVETDGPRQSSSLGSGVIVNAQGQILTALHVVQGSTHITVSFADGTQSPATVQSSDAEHDVAVLTAEHPPGVIVPAVLGGGINVGDEAFAVGHPLGLVDSLTAGVISGLDRSFPLPNGHTLTGLIQFDAAVSPGNSGGPLLNRKGQVIGIVTGLANPSGNEDFVGIGFAEPINTASRAAGAPAQ
jgi:S1-C subfamily serine protease